MNIFNNEWKQTSQFYQEHSKLAVISLDETCNPSVVSNRILGEIDKFTEMREKARLEEEERKIQDSLKLQKLKEETEELEKQRKLKEEQDRLNAEREKNEQLIKAQELTGINLTAAF